MILVHWCRNRKRNSVMAGRWREGCQQAERTEWKHIMECTPSNPQALIAIRWFDVGTGGLEVEWMMADEMGGAVEGVGYGIELETPVVG